MQAGDLARVKKREEVGKMTREPCCRCRQEQQGGQELHLSASENRGRSVCKDCRATFILQHNKIRSRYKDCGAPASASITERGASARTTGAPPFASNQSRNLSKAARGDACMRACMHTYMHACTHRSGNAPEKELGEWGTGDKRKSKIAFHLLKGCKYMLFCQY
jgi:hypothetical protein